MTPPCILCQQPENTRLFSKRGYDFVRCRGCGLVRVDPLPSVEELAAHYEASYRDGDYSAFSNARPIRRAIADHRLNAIRPYTHKGRWLDVGCSSGELLEAARDHGLKAEGIDLSEEAIRRARARGLLAHCRTVESFAPENPYDTITAFDVLEHARDPRAFVRSLCNWLVPGGSLVLTVPDVHSLYPRFLMGRHWFYYVPEVHLFYFDRTTLRRLLHEEGFRVDRLSRAYKPLTLEYAADALRAFNPRLGAVGQYLASRLPQKLANRSWKLYVGEMLTCASRTRSGG